MRDPIFGRACTPGRRELDDSTFPVLWRTDGYRSPWIADYVSEPRAFVNSESPDVEQAVDFSTIDTEPWGGLTPAP